MATWDIFRGGQDLWRRNEMGERYIETGMRLGRLQRDAFESVDKAWAARTVTSERIAALLRQVDADRKVIVAYGKEYELGQRSLIDLLNAQKISCLMASYRSSPPARSQYSAIISSSRRWVSCCPTSRRRIQSMRSRLPQNPMA